jgi:hypothetical protein
MLEKHASGAALTNNPIAPTPAAEEMAGDADVEGDALVLRPRSSRRCSLADQRAADRVGR